MTSATAVHRVLPSFAAPISEFQGYNDDCGPWAALAVLQALRGTPFDPAHLDDIRNTMVAKGWWNWSNGRSAGCNVEQLNNYLTQVAGVHTTAYTTYGQGHPLDTVTLRTILQQRSGIDGIIIELAPRTISPATSATSMATTSPSAASTAPTATSSATATRCPSAAPTGLAGPASKPPYPTA